MIKFDPQNYPYPSKRNVVYARNGMCNAGNPHAASARFQYQNDKAEALSPHQI